MKIFYVTNNGKDWTPLSNIDTAILLADEIKGMVLIWNNDHTVLDLVYSYGENPILARVKHTA